MQSNKFPHHEEQKTGTVTCITQSGRRGAGGSSVTPVKRCFFYSLNLLFINSILLYRALSFHTLIKLPAVLCLTAGFIYYNIKPQSDKASPGRLKILIGGYELILASGLLLVFQTALYIYLLTNTKIGPALIINGVCSLIYIFILILNGIIRTFVTSKQLGVPLRVIFLLVWWMPVINLILLFVICKSVRAEYRFSAEKHRLNEARKGQQVCKTKYPILMLHGIFFRDWKFFNYWGRIPKELTENGAAIFYGNHNSSLPVEKTAEELKRRILEIVEETGCEKVNIIAHSKAGIDARYAISCLDADKHVASLTTISTPHFGSELADKLIDKTPEKLIASIGKKYKAIYTRLGDKDCDFFSGLSELTAKRCAGLNEIMPDREGVLYRSIGSKMSAAGSAGVPLNAGYLLIKPAGGDNDGLVSIGSMKWGEFLGILESPRKRGISHGDMIDLTRKNIPGFDVAEVYVGLVSGLREKGL